MHAERPLSIWVAALSQSDWVHFHSGLTTTLLVWVKIRERARFQMVVLAGWLLLRYGDHVLRRALMKHHYTIFLFTSAIFITLKGRLMYWVLWLEEPHVTVALIFTFIVGIKVIVLIRATMRASIDVGGGRNDCSSVATGTVLACQPISLIYLLIDCEWSSDWLGNVFTTFVLLILLISLRRILVLLLIIFVYDSGHLVFGQLAGR